MLIWVMQALGLGLNIFIALTHNTRRIYFYTFLFNAANLLIYMLTGDWAACASGVLITVRSVAYIYKEKVARNLLPWLFISVHIILGLYLLTDVWQLLTILAPVTVCYSMWFWKGQFQKLRVGNIINAGLWLGYNIHAGLWLIAVCRIMTILANLFGMYRERMSKYVVSDF